MPHQQHLTRRHILRTSLRGALAMPMFIAGGALGKGRPAPSDRVSIGIIGLGSRGFNLIDEFLAEPDARIVALCDVDALHYREKAWGQGQAYGLKAAESRIREHWDASGESRPHGDLRLHADYRELIDQNEVDAVVIATPDHWHAHCTLAAACADKDVYCEKPVTHLFAEGRRVCHALEKRQTVFQAGSQQRSMPLFRRVVELVRNGHLGEVRRIEIGLPEGYNQPMADATVQAPPEHLDYDFWCGPSPRLPYMRARHHRWWRGHRAYGGGVLMDWIGHHNDIAHWALGVDRSGPTTVEAINWVPSGTPVYNTPYQFEIRCAYAGGVRTSISSSNQLGVRIIGEDGWVYARRGHWETSDPRWRQDGFVAGPIHVDHSPGHVRNFLDCIRSRKPCVAPMETAHRSITPGHLGYVSNALGRVIRWDPAREEIIGDAEATVLLMKCDYREPWDRDAV